MAPKPATDAYAHSSASRPNLPTEQTAPLMGGQDRSPVRHVPDKREIDDDPILAWDRQSAADGHAAHPLYVREKVHPGALASSTGGCDRGQHRRCGLSPSRGACGAWC